MRKHNDQVFLEDLEECERFDSVRSSTPAPVRRFSASSTARGFAGESHFRREENTRIIVANRALS